MEEDIPELPPLPRAADANTPAAEIRYHIGGPTRAQRELPAHDLHRLYHRQIRRARMQRQQDDVMRCHMLGIPVRPDLAMLRCELCDRFDGEAQMLICDNCETGWHTFCMRPVVLGIPMGEWFCPRCCQSGVAAVALALGGPPLPVPQLPPLPAHGVLHDPAAAGPSRPPPPPGPPPPPASPPLPPPAPPVPSLPHPLPDHPTGVPNKYLKALLTRHSIVVNAQWRTFGTPLPLQPQGNYPMLTYTTGPDYAWTPIQHT